MTQTTPANAQTILSLFGQMSAAVSAASPDQGFGMQGDVPPEGDHQAAIIGVEVGETNFKRKPDSVEVRCATVAFKYRLLEDPSRDEPRSWYGARFILPLNPGEIIDEPSPGKGQVARFRMERDRLAGHIKSILRRNPSTNTGADIIEIQNLVAGPTSVVVTVNWTARENEGRKYWTDKIKERMA